MTPQPFAAPLRPHCSARQREVTAALGRPSNSLFRVAIALLIVKAENGFAAPSAEKHWSRDALLPAVIRSATSPTTTADVLGLEAA